MYALSLVWLDGKRGACAHNMDNGSVQSVYFIVGSSFGGVQISDKQRV